MGDLGTHAPAHVVVVALPRMGGHVDRVGDAKVEALGARKRRGADAARDHAHGALGQGGFLTRLGDTQVAEPLLAEVYTFPSGMLQDAAQVALSVEAEVTAANCGTDVEAQTLQVSPSGDMRSQDLVLAIPECDARGDFLVLKNLLNDLSIAAN